MEWFRIPERFLATVTSGEVFDDHQGTFSQIRSTLKGFYPEDVLKKKLAATVRCDGTGRSVQLWQMHEAGR